MPAKKYLNEESVIKSYYDTRSSEKTATIFGVTGPHIRNILKKHNIQTSNGNKRRNNLIPAAIQDYCNGLSQNDIFIKYGFTTRYLQKILIQSNISIVTRNTLLKSKRDNFINNEIKQGRFSYQDADFNLLSIQYGLTKSLIKIILKKYDIGYIKKEVIGSLRCKAAEIIKKYQMPTGISKLAKEYNTGFNTIRQILHENNITILSKKAWSKINSNLPQTKEKLKKFWQIRMLDDNYIKKRNSRAYKKKDYILPSGRIIPLQGYEPKFLNYVFSNNLLSESDFEFDKIVRIQYNNGENHYYPDFFIKKYNLVIEIKSAWTLSHTNPEKEKAARKTIYDYLIIVDNDFTEFTEKIKQYKYATTTT